MAKRYRFYPDVEPVEIYWIDSMGTGGWQGRLEESRMECTTVGHLVERRKDRVVVAQSRSHYGYADLLEIPNVAVKRVRRLR